MKKVAALLALSLILGSCARVYFTETQPAKGKRMMQMPTELHGTWTSKTGSTEFKSAGVTIMEIKQDTVENSTATYKDYEYLNLAENFQLYQLKDLYVFNLKDDDTGYWEIGILQMQKNGDIHYYHNNEPKNYTKDKGLKLVEAKYMDVESGEETTTKLLNSNSELQLQHVVFSGKVNYKTLKKTLVYENLASIFYTNGTIFTPDHEDAE